MITCVGIGPGNLDYLTRRGEELIRNAEVITGFTTVNEFVKPLTHGKTQFIDLTYKNQVERLNEMAELHRQGKQCVALFMGDPHFSGFQLLERVETAVGHPLETVPGISSAQVLASKTKVCFDETTFITFHRRGDLEPFKRHLVHVLEDNRNAIIIPHPWDFMPNAIAAYLIEQGVSPDHRVEVWEHLTSQEAFWKGALSECVAAFSDMSIMLIRTL